jgi:hypothetical protein
VLSQLGGGSGSSGSRRPQVAVVHFREWRVALATPTRCMRRRPPDDVRNDMPWTARRAAPIFLVVKRWETMMHDTTRLVCVTRQDPA